MKILSTIATVLVATFLVIVLIGEFPLLAAFLVANVVWDVLRPWLHEITREARS